MISENWRRGGWVKKMENPKAPLCSIQKVPGSPPGFHVDARDLLLMPGTFYLQTAFDGPWFCATQPMQWYFRSGACVEELCCAKCYCIYHCIRFKLN